MKLFLDTSVLLAACGSDRGASREIFRRAESCQWVLMASPYVVVEVENNLARLTDVAARVWPQLLPQLAIAADVVTLDQIAVFEPAKDRPILFSALAWADVLLTLDRNDFGALIGGEFYGLAIMTPGMFLEREREAGRLPTA